MHILNTSPYAPKTSARTGVKARSRSRIGVVPGLTSSEDRHHFNLETRTLTPRMPDDVPKPISGPTLTTLVYRMHGPEFPRDRIDMPDTSGGMACTAGELEQ